jgi:hypothetical protein
MRRCGAWASIEALAIGAVPGDVRKAAPSASIRSRPTAPLCRSSARRTSVGRREPRPAGLGGAAVVVLGVTVRIRAGTSIACDLASCSEV